MRFSVFCCFIIMFMICIVPVCGWLEQEPEPVSNYMNLTVEEKHIDYRYHSAYSPADIVYIIDTLEFGDIQVSLLDYNRVMIGDNITVDLSKPDKDGNYYVV